VIDLVNVGLGGACNSVMKFLLLSIAISFTLSGGHGILLLLQGVYGRRS